MHETEPIPSHEYGFHFKSGRLCLDFAATVGERWRRSFERLRATDDLDRWLVEAGLLEPSPRASGRSLGSARELREAIYRTSKLARSAPPAAADVDLINRWAARADLHPVLDLDGRTRTITARRPVEAALATIARDAIDLLSGPYAERVRECGASDCALLFVDTSRPGRRRWCSMEACGNRTKTRAYRRRKKRTAQAL